MDWAERNRVIKIRTLLCLKRAPFSAIVATFSPGKQALKRRQRIAVSVTPHDQSVSLGDC